MTVRLLALIGLLLCCSHDAWEDEGSPLIVDGTGFHAQQTKRPIGADDRIENEKDHHPVLNMTLCRDRCQKDCKSYLTPLGICFPSDSLFPNDPSWSGLDILDVIVGGTTLHRTIFPTQDGSCANDDDDSSDSFNIPLEECVGPFGAPRPWGTFRRMTQPRAVTAPDLKEE